MNVEAGKYYVYVLFSANANKRYVGHTDDLDRRVAEHNNVAHNPCKFTSKHPGPWTLVHHEVYLSRSEAMKRERWLKSGAGRQWLDEVIGRASPPQAD